MVFSLLLTPVGRYVVFGLAAVVLVFSTYMKIRSDAIAGVEAAATADALRRTENAITAGDAVDTSPNGLLKSDGFKRD
jgi:hypothetical protein